MAGAEILLDGDTLFATLAGLGAKRAGHGGERLHLTGGALDSRTVRPGEIFFALPGEREHGARFVADALMAGAALAIVARDARDLVPATADRNRVVWVDDVAAALRALGLATRALAPDLTVIGVTGSYGKTTTKDMIAAVIEPAFAVHRTPGNFNNHLGVPITLLGLTPRHQVAVIELGMNAPGEIAALAALAAPRIGVVTGVGRAHLAGLGSKAAIIAAKLELAPALGRDGLLIVPADDADLLTAAGRTGVRLLIVSTTANGGAAPAALVARRVTVGADGVRFELSGLGLDGLTVELPIPARVLVTNALLALAAGATLGVGGAAMATALAQYRPPARRLRIEHAGSLLVLDDCYNANPESMAAALTTLAELAVRRRIAVLGDMRELGPETGAAHAELGTRAARMVDRLYVAGDEAETVARAARAAGMADAAVVVAADRDQLIRRLRRDLEPGDGILVKASRALGFENVVAAILAAADLGGGAGGTSDAAGRGPGAEGG